MTLAKDSLNIRQNKHNRFLMYNKMKGDLKEEITYDL